MKPTIKKLPIVFMAIVLMLAFMLVLPSIAYAQEQADTEGEAEEIIPPDPEALIYDIVYPEVQAKAGSTFEFKFNATYDTGDEPFGLEEGISEKTFDVIVEYPEGWFAAVTPQYQTDVEVTAVKLKNLTAESLRVVAIPLVDQEPGEYPISVTLKSSVEGDTLEAVAGFTAIITATYEIDLTTKSGLLSTDVTSGKDNHYKLVIENLGSSSVENIALSSTEPEGWQVNFDSDKIETLAAGEKIEVDVVINPPEKTIAGDYMLSFNATSENSEDAIELRVTVETPTIWGIVGIAIIVVVIVGVAVIFARLGRR